MGIKRKLSRMIRVGRNIAANWFEPPIVILTYHRVTELSDDPEQLAVSPAHFREQLEVLRRNEFPILRFDQPWESPTRTSFVLTFDDGYADNYREALPILREFQFPATFFVSGRAVDGEREFSWDGGHSPQREMFCTLRLAELRKLAAEPLVTVGSHTMTHPRLSMLSKEEQRREIVDGHRCLEELLERKLAVFSYPFGNHGDFNDDSRDICRECDFFRVAANYPGQCHRDTDPLEMPRHLVRNWDGREFSNNMFRFCNL